jgi:hypothetical protein
MEINAREVLVYIGIYHCIQVCCLRIAAANTKVHDWCQSAVVFAKEHVCS